MIRISGVPLSLWHFKATIVALSVLLSESYTENVNYVVWGAKKLALLRLDIS